MSEASESRFPALRRAGYATAVVLTVPLFPFFLMGAFIDAETEQIGWFRTSAVGLLYFSFFVFFPLLLLGSAAKWVVTGRGFI